MLGPIAINLNLNCLVLLIFIQILSLVCIYFSQFDSYDFFEGWILYLACRILIALYSGQCTLDSIKLKLDLIVHKIVYILYIKK